MGSACDAVCQPIRAQLDEISFHQRYSQQLSPLCQIPVSIASLRKLLWYLIYMLKFVASTVERIIWGMFLLMISLYSESDVFIQILLLCLCACEHMSTHVCMCTCVAGSREKSQVLSLSGTVSSLLFCLFVWLVGVFVFGGGSVFLFVLFCLGQVFSLAWRL